MDYRDRIQNALGIYQTLALLLRAGFGDDKPKKLLEVFQFQTSVIIEDGVWE